MALGINIDRCTEQVAVQSSPAARPEEGELREKVYKIARILSIIFVADGIFMLWPLAEGGYAWLTYGKFSYLPVFFPAFLVSLVISAVYAHGFARRSWRVRRAELLFLLVYVLAVGAKVAVFIEARRNDQRNEIQERADALSTGRPHDRVAVRVRRADA